MLPTTVCSYGIEIRGGLAFFVLGVWNGREVQQR